MTRIPTRSSLGREGFTLVELLVVIAIIAIIAGLVVPSLLDAKNKAYMLQDTSNLRGLYTQALSYADKKKFFPIAPGDEPRAHDSLNVFLKSAQGRSLKPDVFISPVQNEVPAEMDEDNRFILDEETLSYTWVGHRIRPGVDAILSSNKYYKGEGEDRFGGYDLSMITVDASGKSLEVVIDEENRQRYKFSDEGLPEGLVR